MSTVADYTGRTIDLAIYHGVETGKRAAIDVSLSGNEVAAGVQRLVQVVGVLLLTEKGSDPYNADKGTTFMVAVRQGRVSTDMDVQTEFGIAAEEIVRQIATSQPDTTPSDEILRKLELKNFFVDSNAGRLLLVVKLTTGDPGQEEIILPISIPLR